METYARKCKDDDSDAVWTRRRHEELKREIRWSTGDWIHQGFETDAFADAWEPHGSTIVSSVHRDWLQAPDSLEPTPTHEAFMNTVCRVLVRLEQADAFTPLDCSPGFRTLAVDHDEDVEHGFERLRLVRGR